MHSARDPLGLPRDLMQEILLQVPVKTLMRFKCINQSWKSLISDPILIQSHLQRSPKNTHILLASNIRPLDNIIVQCSIRRLSENPISSIVNEGNCFHLKINDWIVGSCNGLVCLGNHYCDHEYDKFWVWLWNPATRLVSPNSLCLSINWRSEGFEGLRNVKFGFGYDDRSGTYKVVVMLLGVLSRRMVASIYTFHDNSWRRTSNYPIKPILDLTGGHFVSGTVNWLACNDLGTRLAILSFDLRNETYKHLLLPDGGHGEILAHEPNLGVMILRDCLCFFHTLQRTQFVVWQMGQFGDENSWTPLMNISHVHLPIIPFVQYPHLIPLCITENDDAMVLANNTRSDSEVIIYNQRNNGLVFTTFQRLELESYNYVESLVSPFQN